MSQLSCTEIIQDSIHGMIELETFALQIIDTPEFQRLRDIKQLGLAHFVFPSCQHTRFEHSIGTYHMAKRLIENIKNDPVYIGPGFSFQEEVSIKIASLCHDLGHGPFSHSWETFVKSGSSEYHVYKHEVLSGHIFDRILRNSPKLQTFFTEHNIDPVLIKSLILGEENSLKQKHRLMEQAEYNLAIADAQRQRNAIKPSDEIASSCCILAEKRTPFDLLNKKLQYREALDAQIDSKQNELNRQKQEESLLDKIEQNNLTAELNNQRIKEANMKLENQKKYKDALDNQVQDKPPQLPKYQPNSTSLMFRIFEDNDKKLVERKRLAKSANLSRMKTIQQRRDQLLADKFTKLTEEKEMLKRVHDNLVSDGLKNKQIQSLLAEHMRNDWLTAAHSKKEQDAQRRIEDRSKLSIMVLDQTSCYDRCDQCKRRVDNDGHFHVRNDPGCLNYHFVI